MLEEQLEHARAGLSDQIDAFALNTMTYLREEKELLLEGVGVPEIRTQIEGRHVLIVVRGYDYRGDLDVLRPYISEYKPLLIGRRRRGRRADRGRLQAGHDHRRHGLLLRRGAAVRRRAGGARLPRRPGPRLSSASRPSG